MNLDERIALALGRAQLASIIAVARAEEAESRCAAAESKLAEMEAEKKAQAVKE